MSTYNKKYFTNSNLGYLKISEFNAVSVLNIFKLVGTNLKHPLTFIFVLYIITSYGINNSKAQAPKTNSIKTPLTSTININCTNTEKSSVNKLTYSGKVNIMNPMFGGYEVTSSFYCWDDMNLKNIERMQESIKQDSVLNIQIPDLRGGEMNSSPIHYSDPILLSYKGKLLAINNSADDSDKYSLVFEITGLENYTVERQYKIVPEPELDMGEFQQRSFATNKPLYKKVTYRNNYSGVKPLGIVKQLSIDTKKVELKLKPDSIGDFLNWNFC